MDVEPVADELYAGPAVKGRADDAGGPVQEGGHPVVQVCGVAGPGGKGRHGGVVVCGGVAQGHDTRLGHVTDEVNGPLLLAGHGHKLHLSFITRFLNGENYG